MQETPTSPRFNSYSSSGQLAEIAAGVAQEYSNKEQDSDANGFNCDRDGQEDLEDDHEFEFAFVCCRDPNSFPIWADEIFHNGQIRPIYTDLLLSDSKTSNQNSIRLSLRKLMIQERKPVAISSSSDSDEFEGVPDGTYCVWRPNAAEAASPSPGRCRKSNSTGSTSKIWKFRELLHRSNSDGKEAMAGKKGRGEGMVGKEMQIVRKRSVVKEEEKRSFLPYRQDLKVGFMNNVNGLSRNLHPF